MSEDTAGSERLVVEFVRVLVTPALERFPDSAGVGTIGCRVRACPGDTRAGAVPRLCRGRNDWLSSSCVSGCPHARVSKQGVAAGSEFGAADDHDRVTDRSGSARHGRLILDVA